MSLDRHMSKLGRMSPYPKRVEYESLNDVGGSL
jgi:hypothetical protein